MELVGALALAVVGAVPLLLYYLWQRRNESRDANLAATLKEGANAGPLEIELLNIGSKKIGPIRCILLAGGSELDAADIAGLGADMKPWLWNLDGIDARLRAARDDGKAISVVTCGRGGTDRMGKHQWFLKRWDKQPADGRVTQVSSAILRTAETPEDRAVLEKVGIEPEATLGPPVRTGLEAHEDAGIEGVPGPEEGAARILQALRPDGSRMNASPLRNRLAMSDHNWDSAVEILVARNQVAVAGGRLHRLDAIDPSEKDFAQVLQAIPEDGSRIPGRQLLSQLDLDEDIVRAVLRELTKEAEIASFRGQGGVYARAGGKQQLDAVLQAMPSDGSRIRGADLKSRSGLSDVEFRTAVAALREGGVIKGYRGRHGSYELVQRT